MRTHYQNLRVHFFLKKRRFLETSFQNTHRFGEQFRGFGKEGIVRSLKDFACSRNVHPTVRVLASVRGRVLKSCECNFNWKYLFAS